MSFFDTIYLIAAFAMLIILGLLISYLVPAFLAPIQDDLPAGANATIMGTTNKTVNFLNSSFVALFFIFAAVSIGLTVVVASHPALLALWLLLNVVTLMVWDTAAQFITKIESSVLNTHQMDTAIAFFKGDMAKATVVINVLIGAVLFGKRVMG